MSKWTKLGTFRTDIKGKRHFVFGKGVEIMVNGESIDLGKFRSAKCFDAIESVQGLATKKVITSDELTERLTYIEDKNIKYDVVLPPSE